MAGMDSSETARMEDNMLSLAYKICIIDYSHQLDFCYTIIGNSGHKYLVL